MKKETIKAVMFIVIGVVIFIIILAVIAEFFFGVKLVRTLCKIVSLMVYGGLQYTGILSGVTQTGIGAACDQVQF